MRLRGFRQAAADLFFLLTFILAPAFPVQAQLQEELDSHDQALEVPAEDPILKEQILEVHQALEGLHQEMALRRKKLQHATTESQKATLYSELDGLRKEHDMLERLLHELVEEAKATEWTRVDEALRQVRGLERYQEKQQRREDVLRDRRE